MNVVLQVDIEVAAGNEARFRELLLENARAARQEPGCRTFEALVSPEDANKMMLFEVYDDEAAFEAHQQTPWFRKYLAEAVPLLKTRVRHRWHRLG